MEGKVFGIGLPKTGTKSLKEALTVLGFRALHCPTEFHTHVHETGSYRWNVDAWDAMTDTGTRFFPQLDREYPGSRFILTTRDKQAWLASAERHFSNPTTQGSGAYQHRIEVFATAKFNRAQFEYVYDCHQLLVHDYFRDKSDRLLVLDIVDERKLHCLCEFLNCEAPRQPYPHLGKWLAE